ncbi:MAG: thymidylate kinase [Oscillospiraceae bacterium]|nr:thymidylate kinase [Oscillospiraceae bacterium]
MLITFEGIDGSGKSTQFKLFCDALSKSGTVFTAVKFPRYEENSSALIKMYLSGELGGADAVNAYAASSFYAVDRYASYKTSWGADYERGGLVVTDRYSGSNAIHQGAKFNSLPELSEFFMWLEDYEFNLLKIPKPDLTLFFRLNPEIANSRIAARGGERDIHERDMDYARRCAESADFAARHFGWKSIDASQDEETIHKEVMRYAGFN